MAQPRPGRVKYENPPLIEAVCEFRFAQRGVQHALIAGRFYERVKDEYPDIQMKRGAEIRAGGQGLTLETEDRTVFKNPSANRLVQIGPTMLSINQLKPYSDYPTFRNEIEARLSDYKAVADPKGLTRIGLRYINLLTVPEGQNLEAILNVGFKIPQTLVDKPDPYLLRLEFPHQAGRDRLILIFAKAPDSPEKQDVMLDLDYVIIRPDQIDEQEMMMWVDTAHEAIEDVFHACVTEAALASFRPIRSR
jgi:uncharacterized protein (TIGR04255 family)